MAGQDIYVNGHCYDFTVINAVAAGALGPLPLISGGITAVNYETSLDPGELRGRGPKVRGTTRGEFSVTASISMYCEDFEPFKASLMLLPTPLRGGFMEKRWILNVSYGDPGQLIINDTLRGVRITRVGKSYQRGNEPLMVDLDLHVMDIDYNGVPSVLGSGVPFSP